MGRLSHTLKVFKMWGLFDAYFDRLTEEALKLTEEISLLPEVTKESKAATENFRDFKIQGTEGILNCKIRSIILPLLGDHVLREANHYLILLNEFEQKV